MTSVRESGPPEVGERPAWLLGDTAPLPQPPAIREAGAAPSERPASRRSPLTLTGRTLTAVGLIAALFLAYELVISGVVHDRGQAALLATFRQEITSTTLDSANAGLVEGAPVALVVVPRIGLREVVVEGTSPEELQTGPGHLRSSPVPGEFGNAVIAGRRTTYGGPFRDIDRLVPGDRVVVSTGQGSFVYTVSQAGRAAAGQADPLVGTADSRLTLVTSDSALVPGGRYIVVAKLVGLPIAVPTRAPTHVAADDLGLAGDPAALLFAALWVVLLGIALWCTRRFGSRWPRSIRCMLAAPVVVAVTVLLFASLDTILPGTL